MTMSTWSWMHSGCFPYYIVSKCLSDTCVYSLPLQSIPPASSSSLSQEDESESDLHPSIFFRHSHPHRTWAVNSQMYQGVGLHVCFRFHCQLPVGLSSDLTFTSWVRGPQATHSLPKTWVRPPILGTFWNTGKNVPQKQLKCPSSGRWVKKQWHIQRTGH